MWTKSACTHQVRHVERLWLHDGRQCAAVSLTLSVSGTWGRVALLVSQVGASGDAAVCLHNGVPCCAACPAACFSDSDAAAIVRSMDGRLQHIKVGLRPDSRTATQWLTPMHKHPAAVGVQMRGVVACRPSWDSQHVTPLCAAGRPVGV